jgi:hypothetical protein
MTRNISFGYKAQPNQVFMSGESYFSSNRGHPWTQVLVHPDKNEQFKEVQGCYECIS